MEKKKRDSLLNRFYTIIQVVMVGILFAIGVQWVQITNHSTKVKEEVAQQEMITQKDAQNYMSERQDEGIDPFDGEVNPFGGNPFTQEEIIDIKKVKENAPYYATLEVNKVDINEHVYLGTSKEILLSGVGVVEWTNVPTGKKGESSAIAGHRGYSGVGQFFWFIDKLVEGDEITLTTADKLLTYNVIGTQIVEKEEFEKLPQNDNEAYLTLVSCAPVYNWKQRILVTAKLVDEKSTTEIEETNDIIRKEQADAQERADKEQEIEEAETNKEEVKEDATKEGEETTEEKVGIVDKMYMLASIYPQYVVGIVLVLGVILWGIQKVKKKKS